MGQHLISVFVFKETKHKNIERHLVSSNTVTGATVEQALAANTAVAIAND